jgi:UDP-2-acetamido-3-amino-2,3-dideoxy-glucuronate N-acetyltransferase
MTASVNNTGRGSLGVLDFYNVPFVPQRMFWMSDVPKGETRGKHAHKSCRQFLVVLVGDVIVQVHDLYGAVRVQELSTGATLFLDIFHWLELSNFSENCVVAVLASELYDESEYIRNWDEFVYLQSQFRS